MLVLLSIALALAVAVNWIIFLVAFRLQSDKLTDITYSLTFVLLTLYSFAMGMGIKSHLKILVAALVLIWAIRLGYFLLRRIRQMGKDARFDAIRINYKRFFRFFMIQGVGAWLIALPVMLCLLDDHSSEKTMDSFSTLEVAGLAIALLGFLIEAFADAQKSSFKSKPGNAKKLFTQGFFKWIRYPNYSGEILFWVGIFVACMSGFNGIEWLSVLGPITITALLLFVSGIPYIEKGRTETYGDQPEYLDYVKRTKKIIPFIY